MNFNEDVVLTNDNFKEVMEHMSVSKNMFLNSECIFVEYYDIIKAPWYILLSVLPQNQKIREILDLSEVDYLDSNGLFEWYCNRKNRNFLQDLSIDKNIPDEMDKLLSVLMNNEIFYTTNTQLNAIKVINTALNHKMAKNIIIYTEEKSVHAENDIRTLFSKKNVEYRYGDFRSVLKDVPTDTTYFLSDFNKVVTMAEENHLNYSSLVLPYDFSYNFIMDENGNKVPLIDFTYLGKDHLFKMAYFNACFV